MGNKIMLDERDNNEIITLNDLIDETWGIEREDTDSKDSETSGFVPASIQISTSIIQNQWVITMKKHITLKLFATLAKFLPSDAEMFPISEDTTVEDVIRELEIPPKEIKLIFINGVKKDIKTVLQGGERVAIFPPLGGG